MSDELHPLLRRQLKRIRQSGGPSSEFLSSLIERVDEAYRQADTDRQMIERSLELSSRELLSANSELRAIFNALPDVFLTIDVAGRICDVKTDAEDRFHVPEDWIGKRLLDFPTRDAGRLLSDACDAMRVDRIPRTLDYEVLDTDGEKLAWEARVVALPEGEFLAIIRNITRRKTAEERIRHRAYHDGLTGLANRALFDDRLKQALARARRAKDSVAVFFLDLDRFKSINDTFGHHVGDELLRETARRLSGRTREGDTVARVGGDEFLILIGELKGTKDLLTMAEGVRQALRPAYSINGREHQITASVGVSVFPVDAESAALLVKQADIALYRAKAMGRDNVQTYDEELGARARERVVLEQALLRAKPEEDFFLEYQPQVTAVERRVIGAEALIRWKRGGEIVTPDQWIGVAEDCGVMHELGLWVIRTAASDFSRIDPQMRLSVNVSASQLVHRSFVSSVEWVLQETGLDAGRLELELTESAVLRDLERSARALEQLRGLGVRIALDDFGTGYSSLSHLKDLPISTLKIDRSFVGLALVDPRCMAILRATAAMARELSLEVCAEGVETEQQALLVEEEGCEILQGYYFGRPQPIDRLFRAPSRSNAAVAE